MENNEELYSNKVVRERLEQQIKKIEQSIRYSSMAHSNHDLEQRGDYRRYVQDSELLTELQAKLTELSSRPVDQSYVDNEKIEKRDQQIADLKRQIRETQDLIRTIDANSTSSRDRRNKEKLTKRIEKLKKKQGSIQQSQYIAINRIYFDEIEKIETKASRHGRDSDLERRKDRNIDRANQATDYLENFEWSDKRGVVKVIENIGKAGKYVGEIFIGLVSSIREQMLDIHIDNLAKRDGLVDGARKLPSRLGNAIKNKIQEIRSNARRTGSR